MLLRLRLTDYQLAVVDQLLNRTPGAASVADLVALAIEFDTEREPEPRWRSPRPRARRASRRPSIARLHAVIPAASGRTLRLAKGETLRIEQIKDGQCVDLCAFELGEPRRHFSAARTRAEQGVHPTTGATLWSTPPEIPLLTILADSAPGHDLAFPACTAFEYEQLTGIPGHLSCHELQVAARRRSGLPPDAQPHDPLNLWLPSEVTAAGTLRSWPVAARRGDYVELLAHTDVLVILTTCPDDIYGSSQYEPGPVRVTIRASDGPRGRRSRTAPRPGSPRPPATPKTALARNTIALELPENLRPTLQNIQASGWLGSTPASVARALLFRWYEATAPRA
jgi:uncharacterized protein YcgI (DUF1989 family)